MIMNEQKRPALVSSDEIKVNVDGKIDLYYGPEKPYYNRSWKLNGFEKAKDIR